MPLMVYKLSNVNNVTYLWQNLSILTAKMKFKVIKCHMINRIKQLLSHIIEFIKLVAKK